jgi:hypothetical protein
MDDGEYCILREETVRERRGSYNGFCCRLYPFICWIIIKEGPGNFSGGRSPHWVNHCKSPRCLSCIVCLLGVLFLTKVGAFVLEPFHYSNCSMVGLVPTIESRFRTLNRTQ